MSERPSPVHVVLASASPARKKLLHAAGIEPSIMVSGVDEDAATARAEETYGPLEPADLALVLARAKAEDIAPQVDEALVIGCDSILELDGDGHGKPQTPEQAIERWQLMRGRSGVLHTGHWLIDTREDDGTGATFGATASTTVHFAAIDDDEIRAYVETGEPLRVAGSFTLDGLGAPFVTGIEGDPSNVVGLSLPLLRELLGEVGIAWHTLRAPGIPT
ncbi:Maf family protein [Phycicoccus sp. SLBN-51]|jgi:septum formation protein|uniref:Maf family protein n=1 Tax=Phycicoccus sp. SLBN-51 TaxID=2768447 RepID=UPI001154EC3F|nr:Maf family protein [Phycicoccus sp. SLBN-51]TQJ51804.1 septum formation protein [Phycicoccus sp. SLBN-51]